MKASVVDLRYKMKDVLKALDRRETVTLIYHGKVKGTITPAECERQVPVASHPFFNMAPEETRTVQQQMDSLRGPRFSDL